MHVRITARLVDASEKASGNVCSGEIGYPKSM